MPELETDEALLERAVRDAGAIAKEFVTGTNRRWNKPDGSPVSEADLAVNRRLGEILRPTRPDYAWLSEESEEDSARRTARRTFVIDPIDGTVAFLKGKPHFAICAAVVEDEVPVAAAVYNPLTNECFTAEKGLGARLNGTAIHVSARDRLEGCRMLASKWSLRNACPSGWPEMTIETPNSIAYRVSLVACGAFDAALTFASTHDWDLAAADLILREAGGIITALDGQALRFNRAALVQPPVVAAGPALYAAILSRLEPAKLA